MENQTFKAGKSYQLRFIGDSSLKVEMKVIKISEKSIVAKCKGYPQKRCKIHLDNDGNQMVYPIGSYSMAPVANSKRPF